MQTEISKYVAILSPAIMLVNKASFSPVTGVVIHVYDGDEFPSVSLVITDDEPPLLFPSVEAVLKLLGALETDQNAPKEIPDYLAVIELSTDSDTRDLQFHNVKATRNN